MTRTAEPLANGPFHGFFPEGATLYRLDPPCVAGGPTRFGVKSTEVSHVIVTGLPTDATWGSGPETTVIACDPTGEVDSDFYLDYGPVLTLSGVSDPQAALTRLGYGD